MRCFFEPASPQALWLGRIKAQMNKLIYRRGLFGNEKMDHSATEIYLPHIRDMGAAFMKADTAEAASRWLAVISLWRCAGRSAEPAQLHFGGMSWSVLCDCVCVQAPTKKVGKFKSVPLVAGIHRHTDWMLAFGDDLVLQHGLQQYNSDAKMYVCLPAECARLSCAPALCACARGECVWLSTAASCGCSAAAASAAARDPRTEGMP